MLKRKKKIKICFICSGNIFRSYSADLLTNKYIKDNNIEDLEITSAGTTPNFITYKQTYEKLLSMGLKPEYRYGNPITKELLEKQDLIICMAKHHQEFIKNLGFGSVLYNVVAYGKKEDLMDDEEYKQKHGSVNLEEYIVEIVDYINKATPLIVKNLDKFI